MAIDQPAILIRPVVKLPNGGQTQMRETVTNFREVLLAQHLHLAVVGPSGHHARNAIMFAFYSPSMFRPVLVRQPTPDLTGAECTRAFAKEQRTEMQTYNSNSESQGSSCMSDNPKVDAEESKRSKKEKQQLLLRRREEQLSAYQKAIGTLQDRISLTIAVNHKCDALSSHSKGFYDEIDKLTKGKALVAVTDMTVGLANDIIEDAKKIIKNDPHLDRIKEFVPAGDNPVYPDVLIVIRSVRESLDRHRRQQEDALNRLRAQVQTGRTVIGALQFFLNDEADVEPHEKEFPSEEDITEYVDGEISDSCFTKYLDSQDKYFDFEKLDSESVEEYLSLSREMDSEQPSDSEMTTENEESGTDEEDSV
jgi:hypothetical protein